MRSWVLSDRGIEQYMVMVVLDEAGDHAQFGDSDDCVCSWRVELALCANSFEKWDDESNMISLGCVSGFKQRWILLGLYLRSKCGSSF